MNSFQRRFLSAVSLVAALAAGWFLLVDLSWFEEQCPECACSRTDVHYRLVTTPVHTWEGRRPTVIQQAASDLGVPCQHPNLHRWHKQRRWGLLICYGPCQSGIVGVAADQSWYDTAASKKLLAIAKADPSFANNFHRRVLVERDFAYWRGLMQQISEPKPVQDD